MGDDVVMTNFEDRGVWKGMKERLGHVAPDPRTILGEDPDVAVWSRIIIISLVFWGAIIFAIFVALRKMLAALRRWMRETPE
mmetsp:Transcript_3903/g.7487  ORF Transcript_3903/g.7487 Transcript_3903/m.7487 type:complete len:82 (-) Transcript_3903:89-334(-)